MHWNNSSNFSALHGRVERIEDTQEQVQQLENKRCKLTLVYYKVS